MVQMNPTNTVFDAKRLIGRNFTDKTVQDDMKVSGRCRLLMRLFESVRDPVLTRRCSVVFRSSSGRSRS